MYSEPRSTPRIALATVSVGSVESALRAAVVRRIGLGVLMAVLDFWRRRNRFSSGFYFDFHSMC